jgi:lipopolysaccharide biosynthesis regulator YciM
VHWLLIAAGLAVVAAFLAYRLKRRREEAKAYLKGVRSMISDDPDAAIEALSDAARLGSPEAVETYLALGDLFKREGDITRAIRLHRNMLHRPGLAPGL